jgi:hypothetical protein
MRLLVLFFIVCLTSLTISFDAKRCDHVFTGVEQANVKAGMIVMAEGKDLICVKCFHRQKRIVNYWRTAFVRGDTLYQK